MQDDYQRVRSRREAAPARQAPKMLGSGQVILARQCG
jgi:hypothetical protein